MEWHLSPRPGLNKWNREAGVRKELAQLLAVCGFNAGEWAAGLAGTLYALLQQPENGRMLHNLGLYSSRISKLSAEQVGKIPLNLRHHLCEQLCRWGNLQAETLGAPADAVIPFYTLARLLMPDRLLPYHSIAKFYRLRKVIGRA